MNTRRNFIKTLVGAAVASAIELRMIKASDVEVFRSVNEPIFVAVEYLGELKWVNCSATAVFELAERDRLARKGIA